MAHGSGRTVLITGAGGGPGRATSDVFRAAGWTVYAADLEPPAPAEGVHPLRVDVTSTASVEAMADEVRARSGGRLDVAIPFAGVLGVGPLAGMETDAVGHVLDVNLLGSLRVIRALCPELVAAGGRVVLISSEAGRLPAMPMNGPYAVSKVALEAAGDVLRRELVHLGVSVVIVEPGPFRTDMTSSLERRITVSVPTGSPFAPMAAAVGALAAGEETRSADPVVLARAVYAAAARRRAARRVRVGWDRGRTALGLLPSGALDLVLRRTLARAIRRSSDAAGT